MLFFYSQYPQYIITMIAFNLKNAPKISRSHSQTPNISSTLAAMTILSSLFLLPALFSSVANSFFDVTDSLFIFITI